MHADFEIISLRCLVSVNSYIANKRVPDSITRKYSENYFIFGSSRGLIEL